MIKAGYQLQVMSYENDGDSRATTCVNGLTKEEVSFIVGLLTALKDNCQDNMYEANKCEEEKLKNEVATYVGKHSGAKDVEYLLEEPADYLRDYLGSSEYFLRAFDGFKVYYFPTEVQEVTEMF